MEGPVKAPFTVTTRKCASKDERREVVKGNADYSQLLLGTTFLPARWTELFTFWKALKGYTCIIGRFRVDSITPPFLNTVQANRAIFRVLQSKEDDEDTECITGIQSSRQHI